MTCTYCNRNRRKTNYCYKKRNQEYRNNISGNLQESDAMRGARSKKLNSR